MKNTDLLNRITALLNIKVKLEQQTLENGTVVESDSFSVGDPIFAINGEVKEPLEIGEYVMADGSKLYVTEIGIIGEVEALKEIEEKEVVEEELSVETVEEVVVEELAEVPPTIEEVIALVMEAVQPKIDELQAKLDALSGMQTEMKATLSSVSATKPTTHKPTEKTVNLGKQNTKANVSGTESRIMAMLSK
jgi:hypothetical protein